MGSISVRLQMGLAALVLSAAGLSACAQPWSNVEVAESHEIKTGGAGSASIQVDLARGDLDLSHAVIYAHVQKAVDSIVAYYGRFPVERARLLIIPVADRDGIMQGTTWGGVGGYQGFTRMRIGQHTTAAE